MRTTIEIYLKSKKTILTAEVDYNMTEVFRKLGLKTNKFIRFKDIIVNKDDISYIDKL